NINEESTDQIDDESLIFRDGDENNLDDDKSNTRGKTIPKQNRDYDMPESDSDSDSDVMDKSVNKINSNKIDNKKDETNKKTNMKNAKNKINSDDIEFGSKEIDLDDL